jgi:hypothetical protein
MMRVNVRARQELACHLAALTVHETQQKFAGDSKEQLDEFREDIAAAGKRLRRRLRDDD